MEMVHLSRQRLAPYSTALNLRTLINFGLTRGNQLDSP
jgi:hypothetical protein